MLRVEELATISFLLKFEIACYTCVRDMKNTFNITIQCIPCKLIHILLVICKFYEHTL